MHMLKNITDFEKIKDGRKMLSLTTISDGTLLTCVKESGLFGGKTITNNVFYLDKIRNAWRLFTHSTLESNYGNWMDSWNAFIAYIPTLSNQFKADFLMVNSVDHCARFDESSMLPEDSPYDLYFSVYGRIRIYDNGQITMGTAHLGHIAIAYLDGMTAFLSQAKETKGF